MRSHSHIDLSQRADNASEITAEHFGADLLGFRYTNDAFFEASEEIGLNLARWPGGIIADCHNDSWVNPDGSYVYDLNNPGVLLKTRANGDEVGKDDLLDVLHDVEAADQDLVVLVPTERFVNFDGGRFSIDYAGATGPLVTFLEELFAGDRFDEAYKVPETFILQFGQEYYSGTLIREMKAYAREMGPENLTRADLVEMWDGYVEALGQLYDAMAGAVTDKVAEMQSHLEDYPLFTKPGIALHLGRFQIDPEDANSNDFDRLVDQVFAGSYQDVGTLADQFGREALQSVDTLLWHRYFNLLSQADQGLSAGEVTLQDAVGIWQERAQDVGVETDFRTFLGTSVASLTRNEAIKSYRGLGQDVVADDARWSERTDRAFEEHYQERLDALAYGRKHPAAVIEMFSEMSAAGVDMASAFTADILDVTQAGALTREDVDGEIHLLAGGAMYREFQEHCLGMSVLPGFEGANASADPVNLNVFSDGTDYVLYAYATEITDLQEVVIDLEGLSLSGFDVSAESLTTEVIPEWQRRFGVVDLEEQFAGFDQSAEASLFSTLEVDSLGFRVENGGEKVDHGSGGMSLLRAA